MLKKLRPAVDLMAFKCRTLKVNIYGKGNAVNAFVMLVRHDVCWLLIAFW
jgi:hypothetical protein